MILPDPNPSETPPSESPGSATPDAEAPKTAADAPVTPAPAGPPIIPSLGEEFDRAKWTIPPGKILAIAIVIVAVALAVVSFLNRARPVGTGSIDHVASAELGDKASVLVAINVTLRNVTEKPLFIHEIKSTVVTADGKTLSDDAASPVDFPRYFQAYPALAQNAIAPLQVESKIMPGGEIKGTVVVSFPVSEADFEKRKSISVSVSPYDRRPVVLTK
jgi:hypothetical protein